MPQDAGPIVQLNHAPIQQAKYRNVRSGGSVASCCAFTCPRPTASCYSRFSTTKTGVICIFIGGKESAAQVFFLDQIAKSAIK